MGVYLLQWVNKQKKQARKRRLIYEKEEQGIIPSAHCGSCRNDGSDIRPDGICGRRDVGGRTGTGGEYRGRCGQSEVHASGMDRKRLY